MPVCNSDHKKHGSLPPVNLAQDDRVLHAFLSLIQDICIPHPSLTLSDEEQVQLYYVQVFDSTAPYKYKS